MNAALLLLLSYFVDIALGLFIGTFVFFVAIMKMREIKDTIFLLHWSVRWVCYLIIFVGLILDTFLNWVVLTFVFVEFPREFLSTARVIRHKYHSSGFRYRLAIWFCANWLTPFDACHCKE